MITPRGPPVWRPKIFGVLRYVHNRRGHYAQRVGSPSGPVSGRSTVDQSWPVGPRCLHRTGRQKQAGKVPAKFVPAAAVTRKGRALLVSIGRKGFVGGRLKKPARARHFGVATQPGGNPVGGTRGDTPKPADGSRVAQRCGVLLKEGWNPKRPMGTITGEGAITMGNQR